MSSLNTYWLCRAPGASTEGLFTVDQLRAMYEAGNVTHAAIACCEGTQDWVDLPRLVKTHRAAISWSWIIITVLLTAGGAYGGFEYGKRYVARKMQEAMVKAFSGFGKGLQSTPEPEKVEEKKTEVPVQQYAREMAAKLESTDMGKVAASLKMNEVDIEFDRFKEETTYSYKTPVDVAEDVTVGGWVGRNKDASSISSFFMVRRIGEGWLWLKSHETMMKIDGDVWKEETRLMTDTGKGGNVVEAQIVFLTPDRVLKIATAKDVAVQIGLREFKLENEHRIALLAPYLRCLQDVAELKTAQ